MELHAALHVLFCENEFFYMTSGISLRLSEFHKRVFCFFFVFFDVTDIIACDQARSIISFSLKPCDVCVFQEGTEGVLAHVNYKCSNFLFVSSFQDQSNFGFENHLFVLQPAVKKDNLN